jgi:hypothetical protein
MTTLVARLWIALLTAVVVAPLLAPGYVLSYDMVFVPDQALRADYFGFAASLPRAVPSDAVVSLVSVAVPGQLIQKLMLVGVFAAAGEGIRRLLAEQRTVAQLAAISWYLWNPFVAERLVLGQWVVLVGYAALPWVLLCGLRARQGSSAAVGGTVLMAGVAALGASGGVVAAALAICLLVLPGSRLSTRMKISGVAAVVGVNAPWIGAGLVQAERAVSGLAAVEAFAARGEPPLPAFATVLGLGGIWNAETVPASRESWVAVLWLGVLLAVVAAGVGPLWRRFGTAPAGALTGLAAVGYCVAMAGAVFPSLVADITSAIPGTALFRDGTRYLAPVALFQALAFGLGVGRLAGRIKARVAAGAVAVGLTVAPMAVLPDLAWGAASKLQPVDYPASWAAVAAAIERDGSRGDALYLPLSPYRAFPWNDSRPGLDPGPRFMDPNALVSDALEVGDVQVQAEEPRAAEAAQRFADGDLSGLAAMGVGYVVATADVASVRRTAEAAGATALVVQADIAVFAVEGAVRSQVSGGRVVVVGVGWAVYAVSIALGTMLALRRDARHADSG